MPYFTDETKSAWHEGHIRRLGLGDPCAPVRLFVAKLDAWLQSLEKEHPGLLQREFGEAGRFLDSFTAIKAVLSDFFMIPIKGSFHDFVHSVEHLSTKRLLEAGHSAMWNDFLTAANRRHDASAVTDFLVYMDRLDRRVSEPTCPAAFTRAYPQYVRAGWIHVRWMLYVCEFVPAEAIGLLCYFLELFSAAQCVRHGIPVTPGWWTDVGEGEFRPLTEDEIVQAKKEWGMDGVSESYVPGNTNSDASPSAPPSLDESAPWFVDIKNQYNEDRLMIVCTVNKITREFGKGLISESRLFEVIFYCLHGVNTLTEMSAATSARDKHRDVSQAGARRNQQKGKQVEQWAIVAAKIVLDAEPGLTISEIAELLASEEQRAAFAAMKLADDPEAQVQLTRHLPRKAGGRSLYNKLRLAIEDGRLVVPPSRTIGSRRWAQRGSMS